MRTLLDADLEFSVSVGGRSAAGALRGSGSELVLDMADPDLLGGTGTAVARDLARALARRGVRLTVRAGRPLVTAGLPSVPWWQRRLTGSPHIAVASLPAALRLLRLRRAARAAAPLVPPATPLPLAPTLRRRPRRPTVTHDPDHGGYPRLVMAPGPHPRPGERQPVFLLGPVGSRTTIGSAAGSDIRLAGLDAHHAEVRHTDDDEFWLVHVGAGQTTRVNGAVVPRALLRTGTRVELGSWTLSFVREEYADHGRPFGGRIGGELGHQRPQPSREELERARYRA